MAVRFFIHAGFEFRTIDVAPSVLGLGGASNIAITVLEDVVAALTGSDQFTPILAGQDADAKMNTLTSYWTTRQGGIQEVRRDVMNSRAPLIEPLGRTYDVDETRQIPANAFNVHKEANQWILPQGFDQVVAIPTRGQVRAAQLLNLVRALMFDHTNVQKFSYYGDAWTAYNNLFLTRGLEDEMRETRADYYVDPDIAPGGSG